MITWVTLACSPSLIHSETIPYSSLLAKLLDTTACCSQKKTSLVLSPIGSLVRSNGIDSSVLIWVRSCFQGHGETKKTNWRTSGELRSTYLHKDFKSSFSFLTFLTGAITYCFLPSLIDPSAYFRLHPSDSSAKLIFFLKHAMQITAYNLLFAH